MRHLEHSRDAHGDGYYHIIHFDVHGSLLTFEQYQQLEKDASPFLFTSGYYGQSEFQPYAGLRAFLLSAATNRAANDLVADQTIANVVKPPDPHRHPQCRQLGMQVGESETSLGSRPRPPGCTNGRNNELFSHCQRGRAVYDPSLINICWPGGPCPRRLLRPACTR